MVQKKKKTAKKKAGKKYKTLGRFGSDAPIQITMQQSQQKPPVRANGALQISLTPKPVTAPPSPMAMPVAAPPPAPTFVQTAAAQPTTPSSPFTNPAGTNVYSAVSNYGNLGLARPETVRPIGMFGSKKKHESKKYPMWGY